MKRGCTVALSSTSISPVYALGVATSQSSLAVRFTISEERIKLGLRAGGAKNTQSSAKWTPLRWIRDPESPGRGKETPTPGSPIAGKFAPVAPQLSLKVAAVQSLCTIQLPVQPQCVPFYLRPANCLATLRTVRRQYRAGRLEAKWGEGSGGRPPTSHSLNS